MGLEEILSKVSRLSLKATAPILAATIGLFSCGGAAGESASVTGLNTNANVSSRNDSPLVFAQMHIWYHKGGCPQNPEDGFWRAWSWSEKDDPCSTVQGAPWLREISSPAYPLIGPYHAPNPDVMRWQVRLAKASGIDGFFVSVYSWAEPRFKDAFRDMLRVAYEENFKVGIEGWKPNPGEETAWKSEVLAQIDEFTSASPYSSAFLRINNKPAYWLASPQDWMGSEELVSFLDSRQATWLIVGGGMSNDALVRLNQQLLSSEAQQFITHSIPSSNGWVYNRSFAPAMSDTIRYASRGLIPISHGYPGFDESRIANDQDRPNRYGFRMDGQALRDLLDDSKSYDAKMVFIESFNDWNEATMLEPGMDITKQINFGQEEIYKGDPYAYLKIISAYKGKTFQAPAIPCSIVDEKMDRSLVNCE